MTEDSYPIEGHQEAYDTHQKLTDAGFTVVGGNIVEALEQTDAASTSDDKQYDKPDFMLAAEELAENEEDLMTVSYQQVKGELFQEVEASYEIRVDETQLE